MFTQQRSPRIRTRFAYLAVIVALVSCAKQKEVQDIGAVLAVRGDWRIVGQQHSLLEGQAVPAGGVLEDIKVQTGDSLNIVLLSGEHVEAVCDRDSDLCTKGLHLPGTYANKSPETRQIIQAVRSVLLDHQPEIARSF